jgi:outer membrane protein OmpA-like peptidoglycan-associated protein
MALNLSKHDGDLTPGKGEEKKIKLNLDKKELPKVSSIEKDETEQKADENQSNAEATTIVEASTDRGEEKKSKSPLLYIVGALLLVGAILIFMKFSSNSESGGNEQSVSDTTLASNYTAEDTLAILNGSAASSSDTVSGNQPTDGSENSGVQNEIAKRNGTSTSSEPVASGNKNGNSGQSQSSNSSSTSTGYKEAVSSNKQLANNNSVSNPSTPNASAGNAKSSDIKNSSTPTIGDSKLSKNEVSPNIARNTSGLKSNNSSSTATETNSKPIRQAKSEVAVSFSSNTIANFDAGSPAIVSLNEDLVKLLLTYLNENGANKLTILGYASSDGDEQQNLVLSEARAEKVKKMLISRGANIEKITAKGMGIVNPIADNATLEGRKKNRRVEFIKK